MIKNSIEFRAWDIENKRMVYFDEFFVPTSLAPSAYDIIPANAIPMQFTGLFDKNNQKIYVGDICDHTSGDSSATHRVIIYFDYGSFRAKNLTYNVDENLLEPSKFNHTTSFADWTPRYAPERHYTKIGNIFENPELLVYQINWKK